MAYFKITDQKGIRTAQLDNGKANTIHQGLVDEFRELLHDTLKDDGILGLHLTGKEHFFSAGLDIVQLYEYDSEEYERFWESFMYLIYEMVAFDKPMVAAVTGHAPAGGCIFSMAADYRFMAEGKYRIGLNEVPVGIIVPPSVFHLYAFWIGNRLAGQYLLEGTLHSVQKALEIGLVDEVVPLEEIDAKALEKLETYVTFHQGAWRHTKKNSRKSLLRELEVRRDVHFELSLKQWWSPEVREMMQGFIDKLKR